MNKDYTAACAVCGGPGEPECPCEGQRLQECISRAERAWIDSWVGKTREWAMNNAINAVTTLFNRKREGRKAMFREQVMSIPYWPQYQEYRGQPPLHPQIVADVRRRFHEAEMTLRRGIDWDWKQCVVKYPEVLAHFYSQIKIPLPQNPEAPFSNVLAGGGAPRPPSVVNINPAQSTVGQAINRAATAPPKKQRRASKVSVDQGLDGDTFAILARELQSLEGLGKIANGGRMKAATPGPTSSTPMPRSRPSQKRRESKDFGLPRQVAGGFPHVPPPASAFGGRTSIYDSFGH